MARIAISNHEQTDYIRARREFYTRQGVYRGYTDYMGDYVVYHWGTLIARFNADGTVWLNPRDYSVTTSAFKGRIRSAMTRDERLQADATAAREIHATALTAKERYGHAHANAYYFGNRSWRQWLARFDYALDYVTA